MTVLFSKKFVKRLCNCTSGT